MEFEHLDIAHVGVEREWKVVARRHIAEISQENPNWDRRSIREDYQERMETHQLYYDRLHYFYDHVTMFPVYWAQSAKELAQGELLVPHRHGKIQIH
tara:strand:- start:876 stop:1166 length:291 start_codon:yes stop_codon:yes gene_type:complete